jgi:ribose-phosphate pyrophosphokinase
MKLQTMYTAKLNLAYPEKSQINFTINHFPDGQQSVTLHLDTAFNSAREIGTVLISSRLNNFRDLELIICATAALRNNGIDKIGLYVPYFIGARSDRRFSPGDVHYLKQVVGPIINAQKFFSVVVLDPHSDVLEACIDNLEKIDNSILVNTALEELNKKPENIVLVSPDAGAYKKIFDVAKKFQIPNLITASKVRDLSSGKILRTEIPDISSYTESHSFIIVDDICDGGRTFIELAKEIRKHNAISDIHLIVTHGIFSQGFSELGVYFTKIFSTNSYTDFKKDSLITLINVF